MNRHRRRVTRAELDDVLTSGGVDPGLVVSCEEFTEATFNTVYRLGLTDGTGLVLKVAPDPDAPSLAYERDLISTEVLFYELAGGIDLVPTPRVHHVDAQGAVLGNPCLLMSQCAGQSWFGLRDRLRGEHQRRLRTDLGRIVAAVHEVTGPGFGYPQDVLMPSWREAFRRMTRSVLADAARYAVDLPRPVAEIDELMQVAVELLTDGVDTPALVHFDLWPGNIVVDCSLPVPGIGGLVDAERAFWGDPVADFASLALFADVTRDAALLHGYRSAGGRVSFDAPTTLRLSLYRSYLYLIMLVESVLRSPTEMEQRQTALFVGRHLKTELASLAKAFG